MLGVTCLLASACSRGGGGCKAGMVALHSRKYEAGIPWELWLCSSRIWVDEGFACSSETREAWHLCIIFVLRVKSVGVTWILCRLKITLNWALVRTLHCNTSWTRELLPPVVQAEQQLKTVLLYFVVSKLLILLQLDFFMELIKGMWEFSRKFFELRDNVQSFISPITFLFLLLCSHHKIKMFEYTIISQVWN